MVNAYGSIPWVKGCIWEYPLGKGVHMGVPLGKGCMREYPLDKGVSTNNNHQPNSLTQLSGKLTVITTVHTWLLKCIWKIKQTLTLLDNSIRATKQM